MSTVKFIGLAEEEVNVIESTHVLTEETDFSTITTEAETKSVGEDEGEEEEYVYFVNKQGQRRRLPPYVKFYTSRTSSVGWIHDKPQKIICHAYYTKVHILPQCPMKLYEVAQVVSNYDWLMEDQKKTVPDKSYHSAKPYLSIRENLSQKAAEDCKTDPKN